jgi:hypothetical protein
MTGHISDAELESMRHQTSYVMLGRNEMHVMHVLYVVNCF